MKRLLIVIILIIMEVSSIVQVGLAEEKVEYTLTTGESLNLSLHSGVKLGMTKEEVFNAEHSNGFTLCFSRGSTRSGEEITTVDEIGDAFCLEIDCDVANIPNSSIYYHFNDNNHLVLVEYKFPFSQKSNSVSQKEYDELEARYTKNYGPPFCSKASGSVWEYKESLPIPSWCYVGILIGRKALDYSQRLAKGTDGSVILIEHSWTGFDMGEVGLWDDDYQNVLYFLYDAESVAEVINQSVQNDSDL